MGKNEVAVVKESTDLTVAGVPAPFGIEINKEDMMIPFIKVIQSLSEEVMQGKDKFNPDVRPGDIYDSVTQTIFKNAKAIVCGLKKYYAEWTPEVRGKLVGKHPATSDVVKNAVRTEKKTDKGQSFYQLSTPEGNELVETYGLVLLIKTEDGLPLPAVLTLAKTSFMVGKQLSTVIAIHQAKGTPIFKMGTVGVSNSKGSWYKPTFVFDGYEKDSEVIGMAAEISKLTDSILYRKEEDASETTVEVVEDNIL